MPKMSKFRPPMDMNKVGGNPDIIYIFHEQKRLRNLFYNSKRWIEKVDIKCSLFRIRQTPNAE